MAKRSTVPPTYADGQLKAVHAALRGYGGRAPIGVTFFEALGLKKREYADLVPKGDVAEFQLFNVHTGDSPEESVERFRAVFLKAARWLRGRPNGAFDGWRKHGRRADVLVTLHAASTQWGKLDGAPNLFVLPPEFLVACGEAGLPVVITVYC